MAIVANDNPKVTVATTVSADKIGPKSICNPILMKKNGTIQFAIGVISAWISKKSSSFPIITPATNAPIMGSNCNA